MEALMDGVIGKEITPSSNTNRFKYIPFANSTFLTDQMSEITKRQNRFLHECVPISVVNLESLTYKFLQIHKLKGRSSGEDEEEQSDNCIADMVDVKGEGDQEEKNQENKEESILTLEEEVKEGRGLVSRGRKPHQKDMGGVGSMGERRV